MNWTAAGAYNKVEKAFALTVRKTPPGTSDKTDIYCIYCQSYPLVTEVRPFFLYSNMWENLK